MPRERSSTTSIIPSTKQLPIPAPQPSFGQMIKEGFGFGVGSSLARTAIDSFFDRMKEPTAAQLKKESCLPEKRDFESCILTNQSGSNCEYYSYVYEQCIMIKSSTKIQ